MLPMDRIYPIQFIGSESTQSNDWLWGWENINGFDDSLLKLVDEARAFGQKVGFNALTVPNLPLTHYTECHRICSFYDCLRHK